MPKKTPQQYDVISVGSVLRDMTYYSDDFHVIENPNKDAMLKKFIAVEYGAKIRSLNVFFQSGGGAANSAVNFSGLDLQTGIVTGLGADEDGDILLHHFEKHNIDTKYIVRSKKFRTGFSFIAVVPSTGDRTALIYYGASQELPIPATTIQRIPTKWFYVSSLNMPQWRQVIQMLVSHETAKLAWNPGSMQLAAPKRLLATLLKETDLLIVNRDEGIEIAIKFGHMKKGDNRPSLKQLATFLRTLGPTTVLVTDGRDGAVAARGTETFFHGVPKGKPKDTTGAGDCYGSSFLAGLLHFDGNIPAAMELAQVNTNSKVRHIGAQNGLLPWKKLPARIQRNRKS